MTPEERFKFATEAGKAIDHMLVQDVIKEQLFNLQKEESSLANYGLHKIALYAAQVARAQALGIDIQELTDRPLGGDTNV